MELERFQGLPTNEVAQLVREAGSEVCVFPIKGTRRWFMLENPSVSAEDFASQYLNAIMGRITELFQLIFEHGLDTLLTPCFDLPVMKRGEAYMQMAAEILSWLATHPHFLNFYETHQVRVHFYGDHRRFFEPTPYAYLSDLFDQITAQTAKHGRRRLFYGLFVSDPAEAAAQAAARYYTEHGRMPDGRALVETYYGEYVKPVDLFIGFGKLRAFDMPLLTTGKEDLYFTVSPSPYLTERQLRDILYDHLFTRGRTKTEHQPEDLASIRGFYEANKGRTIGIGVRHRHGAWCPLPQVKLPTDPTEISGGEQ